MTAAEWLDRLDALLSCPPDPAPLPADPPDPAAALEWLAGRFGPPAAGPNDALTAHLTQLRYRLTQHADHAAAAAAEAVRRLLVTADQLARAGRLPGGAVLWDTAPPHCRLSFAPATLGVWYAVGPGDGYAPPPEATTVIQGRPVVVFGQQRRAWVSFAFARRQGETLAAVIARQEYAAREKAEAAEAERRRREEAMRPKPSPAEVRERARDERIATIEEQLRKLQPVE